MKRVFTASLLLLIGLSVLLNGCSAEYQANMDARKQIAWVQSTNQRLSTQAVMSIVEKILTPFEEQWAEEQGLNQKNKGLDYIPREPVGVAGTVQPRTVSDSTYAMTMMAGVMSEMIKWNGKAELMRARAQAIQYITPLIQAIYSQHMADFGTPMSTNEVVNNFVNQLPFLATVGGMYALGAKGIENAGTKISNSIGNDGTITSTPNIGNGTSVNGGSTLNTGTQSTEIAAPEAPVTE